MLSTVTRLHTSDKHHLSSTHIPKCDVMCCLQACLMDYSRTVTAPKDDVRVLEAGVEEDVFQLPSQAMACRLEGIDSSQWTEEAINFFEGTEQIQQC